MYDLSSTLLLQIIIPILIKMADVQIKKSLSLMYSITKGYVKSQEDAKLLVRQISGRESIYQVRSRHGVVGWMGITFLRYTHIFKTCVTNREISANRSRCLLYKVLQKTVWTVCLCMHALMWGYAWVCASWTKKDPISKSNSNNLPNRELSVLKEATFELGTHGASWRSL